MDIQHISKITEMISDSMVCYSEHAFVSQHLEKAPQSSIFQYMYAHEGRYTKSIQENIHQPLKYNILTFLLYHEL